VDLLLEVSAAFLEFEISLERFDMQLKALLALDRLLVFLISALPLSFEAVVAGQLFTSNCRFPDLPLLPLCC
jgi:hypothetical protein